jgi:hypothetical protein
MKPSKSSGRVVFDRQQSASLIEAFTIYEDSLDFKNALIVCFREYGFDLLRYTNSTDDALGVYDQAGMFGDVLVISWQIQKLV